MKKRVLLAPPIHRRPTTGTVNTESLPPRAALLSTPPLKRGWMDRTPIFSEILENARKLSDSERKELAEALLLDLHVASKAVKDCDRDIQMWSTAVYEGLTRVVGGGGAGLMGPTLARKHLAVVSAWKPVEEFMQMSGLADLTVIERQQCYNLLAMMTVSHAKAVARKSGAPLCVKLVSKCTGSLSGLFDNAFPGYLAAGLAKAIIRRHGMN